MERKRFAIVTALFHNLHDEKTFYMPPSSIFTDDTNKDEWMFIVFTDLFSQHLAAIPSNSFPCHTRFYDTQSLSHGISYFDDFHRPDFPNCLENNASDANQLNFIKLNLLRLPQLQQFERIIWFDGNIGGSVVTDCKPEHMTLALTDHIESIMSESVLDTFSRSSAGCFTVHRHNKSHMNEMSNMWLSVMQQEQY